MTVFSHYPWQTTQWQQLLNQYHAKRLPHAILLVGARGLGKTDFAHAFANYLLCLQPENEKACGHCKSCQLNAAGTHPDFKLVLPEEEGKQIKIADIRDIGEFASQTAQQGGYRVIVISPAEAMNTNAANALLKNLEEPGSQTLFILVSHVQGRLSATVRSRCQRVIFNKPDREVARQWLSSKISDNAQLEMLLVLAQGAPLAAWDLFESDAAISFEHMTTALINIANGKSSVVEVAKQWAEQDVTQLLGWFLQLLGDAFKMQIAGLNIFKNRELDVFYKRLSQVSVNDICHFIDKISYARQLSLSTANPNKQMLLEELLISWSLLLKH